MSTFPSSFYPHYGHPNTVYTPKVVIPHVNVAPAQPPPTTRTYQRTPTTRSLSRSSSNSSRGSYSPKPKTTCLSLLNELTSEEKRARQMTYQAAHAQQERFFSPPANTNSRGYDNAWDYAPPPIGHSIVYNQYTAYSGKFSPYSTSSDQSVSEHSDVNFQSLPQMQHPQYRWEPHCGRSYPY